MINDGLHQFLEGMRPEDEAVLPPLQRLLDWPVQAVGVHRLSRAQMNALLVEYQASLPGQVIASNPGRTASTLLALGEAGIDAVTLKNARRMAFVRDTLAQMVTSTIGYASTFMAYNSALERLMAADGKADAAPSLGDSALASLMMTFTAMAGQRFLRQSEMMPGWTQSIEIDGKGHPQAHITQPDGWMKVAIQYWPFLMSLCYATFALDGQPDEQVAARRNLGFFATLGVAAHRMLVFKRDLPWLDASTERKRHAMLQTIHELTSVAANLRAAITYPLRPVAGLAGSFHLDPYRRVEDCFFTGSEGPPAPAPPPPLLDPPRRATASLGDDLALSARRARLFGIPLMVFNGIRALGVERLGSMVGGALGDFVLIIGWGWSMANAEQVTAQDSSIRAENQNRAARQSEVLARQHRAEHPDPAQDPV